ncbi:putative RNA-directed DNA polymerase from transposon X-element [Trichonephila clavipes]|nr:putative RNA-directed DNA polymerase from transposon X-element [Trichonephila clavipes]
MLFSLYVAGIEKIIPGECDIGMFPDDIGLWCSSPDMNHIESTLTSTLTEVRNFANDHKLIFNVSKSCVSFFTTNKRLYSYQPQVIFHDQPLSYVKHPKHLGFVLDQEFMSS